MWLTDPANNAKTRIKFSEETTVAEAELADGDVLYVEVLNTKTLEWVAIDYFNIVIHIFNEETRNYYQFERLWGDAKIEKINA